jgi:hypothetical protein
MGATVRLNVEAGKGPSAVKLLNRLGFDVGESVHINLGKADVEYVQLLAADPENQTFTASLRSTTRWARRCAPPSG